MKLTHIRHAVILTLLGISLITLTQSSVFGQSSGLDKQNHVAVEVISQPDCPLIIDPNGFDTSYKERLELNFAVKNISEKKVIAFILSHKISDNSHNGALDFLSPLNIGQTMNGRVAELNTDLTSESKISLSIEYVLFTDGTSWGKISKKNSEFIEGYMEGLKKTLSELQLLAKSDKGALVKLLEQEAFAFDRSRLDKIKTQDWQGGFEMGYRWVWIELKSIYIKFGIEMLPLKLDEFHKSTETIWLAR
jgi:hypothetical protein